MILYINKCSFLGLAYNASVGSAPNSPKHSPKSSKDNLNGTGIDCCDDQQPSSLVPTISGKKLKKKD